MTCPDCIGEGQAYYYGEYQPCKRCEGTGELADNDVDNLLRRICELEDSVKDLKSHIRELEAKL